MEKGVNWNADVDRSSEPVNPHNITRVVVSKGGLMEAFSETTKWEKNRNRCFRFDKKAAEAYAFHNGPMPETHDAEMPEYACWLVENGKAESDNRGIRTRYSL